VSATGTAAAPTRLEYRFMVFHPRSLNQSSDEIDAVRAEVVERVVPVAVRCHQGLRPGSGL
jgi:hypothetical protein